MTPQANLRSVCVQETREPAEAEAAEQLSRKTLEEARELLGSSHQITLKLISNLAVLLQTNKNHIDEAEELCREALHAQRRLLCTRHPDTLIAINNLAIVLMKNGKLDEAEALHREALAAKRDVHGTNHTDTLMSINNLAAVLLQDECRLEDVELLFREALEAKRNMLGKKHPDTLKSLNNLASVLIRDKNNGKLDEVELLFREALQAKRETLGARHPETITSINNLAALLQKNGRLNEAEPLFSEVLDAMRVNADFKAREEAATAVASSLLADEEAEKAAEVSTKHNSTKKKQRQKKHKGRGYLTQPHSHGAQVAGRRDGDGEDDAEENACTEKEASRRLAAEEAHMAMARAAADGPPIVIEIRATELQMALDAIGAQGQVGEGGFGKVFAAELPSLPGWGRVAIKLATSMDMDPSALLHEVQLLRKCSHPNVLPLLGFCGDRRAPCMITPLMRGGSLDDRLLRSPASSQRLVRLGFTGDPHLSWQQRLSALCDAARGLLHLHASSTLHRDVKTGNILLDGALQSLQTAGGTSTSVYRAFLSDVGLAKVHEVRTGGAAAMTHYTTSSVAFSVGFCDPTFINSNQHSKRTDAYGIGISLLMSMLGEPANRLLAKWEDGIADFVESDETAKLDLLVDKASAAAGWPVAVTHGLVRLVHGLSVVRNSMRLSLHDALEEMEALLQAAGSAAHPPAPEPARVLTREESTESTCVNIGNISHSGHSGGLTRLVGKLDRLAVDCGGDAALMRMQKHVNAAFISMMMRLEAKYIEHGNAPLAGHLSELEKINTLAPRHTCQKLNGHAHTLRIWWNAAKHDRGGWTNPPSDQEAQDVTQGVMSELTRLCL
jgi:serine/threonine protein kinase/tetratricopeptide (TPR) repeat protein